VTSVFETQLDYIFFLYGFSFIALAAVCRPLVKRERASLPWAWLGLFGLTHGCNEWFDMLALVFGDSRTFAFIRYLVMASSFGFLLEFARRGSRRFIDHRLGSWAYLPLIAVLVFSMVFLPMPEANALARYGVGLTGAMGSAWVFFRYRKVAQTGEGWLGLVAWGLIGYGITSGFFVPPTRFFPGNLFNAQSFSALFGTPVQVFRAGFATLIALGIWKFYLRTTFGASPMPKSKGRLITRLAEILACILVLGWAGTEAARSYSTENEKNAIFSRFQIAEERIHNSIILMQQGAETLAKNPDLVNAGVNPSPGAIHKLNESLDPFSSFLPNAIAYLLDLNGKVIASSNRSSTRSFVGNNYSQRPYFRGALAGRTSHFWSVGLKTQQMSYYTGVPVFSSNRKVLGVLAYRVAFEDLQAFKNITEPSLILDSNGLVVEANDQDLLFRGLGPLSAETLQKFADYYQSIQIQSEPIFARVPTSGELVTWKGQEYRFWVYPSTLENWKFVFLSKWRAYTAFRLFGIVITMFMALIVTGVFAALQQDAENQKSLIESEERYRQIFQNNGAVMLIINPKTGRIEDANFQAIKFYRAAAEELRERSIFDLTLLDRNKVSAWLAQVERNGRNQAEFRHQIGPGDERDVEIFSMWLSLRGSYVVFAIIHDISERKQIEAEKEKFQAQLFHSEKLASIGTLAAGVGHEINNPLAIIRGLVEVIRSRLQGEAASDEVHNFLNKQELAIERISKIVNGLRTFARSDTSHIEPVNLHLIIQETLSLIEQIYEKSGLKIIIRLESSNPEFLGNHGKVQQVIMNLLSNAKDALEEKNSDRVIEIVTSDHNDMIRLEVRDNGAGISKARLGRIFDPFFTTKPPGKGTGLGLPISRSIVESIGGKLIVESVESEGTTVLLELARMKSKVDGKTAAALQQPVSLSGTVLIVDDEADIRELFREYLSSLGLQVQESSSGNDAELLMSKSVFNFAVIDLHMPGMSGAELIEKVRQLPTCAQTKLIATSAGIVTQFSGEQRDRLRHSIHGYLQKPFDRSSLLKLLRTVVQSESQS